MNYREAREYTQTIGRLGMVLGLDSMKRLLDEIGNPQEQLKFVHVAGTNGKGSVITYISEMLIQAGYKTGVYTSPAVFEPLEIYRINGVNMLENVYGRLMETMKMAMDNIVAAGYPSPTLYELETALALLYFAEEACEIVLLETGLGGLLDATNCIPAPICAVLTSVSRDHMGVLGNTIEEIAAQKAGIIKEGCSVVSSSQEKAVVEVIKEVCYNKKVPFTVVEEDKFQITQTRSIPPQRSLQYKGFPKITIGLAGEHQVQNAATALEAAEVLRDAGYVIEDEHVAAGIRNAQWPGRLTVLSNNPLMIMDGAHNEKAAMALAKVLKEDYPNIQWCFVMGVLADKEYDKIVEQMAAFAKKVWTITPDNPRALDGEQLAAVFRKYGCEAVEAADIPQAVKNAVDWCQKDISQKDTSRGVLAFGSFTFLREFREQTSIIGNSGSRQENDVEGK